jgi:Flp pilus assembly protein TadD
MKVVAALMLAALLGGCATPPPVAPPQPPPGLFEDGAFAAPTVVPDVAGIFALSPAMLAFVERDMALAIRQIGPQRALIEALQRKAHLKLEYDAELTRNAAQAFDARSGNCLSLVVMTAAFARHLALPVTYQALIGHESYSRSGDLSFANGHVNITVAKRLIDRVTAFDATTELRIDFAPLAPGRAQALQPVSQDTIVSMFLNNRAAEHLVRGEVADAYAHAREAVRQDPANVSALNTLGVIYQRHGLPRAAERAYAAAVERDPAHKAALGNLARLFEQQGRLADAQPLRARLAMLEREAPFEHFDRGVAAARAGDYRTAREHLLREMRRDPDYHEFHFWLAVALYGLGDTAQARHHLDTAMRNSTTVREQAIYASKLRNLEPGRGSTRAQ